MKLGGLGVAILVLIISQVGENNPHLTELSFNFGCFSS